MRRFKKIFAGLMAVASLAVCTTGMSANASNSSSWYMRYASGASGNRFSYSGTVTGLANGVDTGVTFKCTGYSDPNNMGYAAKCDIESAVKLYPSQYVFLNYNGASGTCLFVTNWYALTGSDCKYTVSLAQWNGSYYVNVSSTSTPFAISGYAC